MIKTSIRAERQVIDPQIRKNYGIGEVPFSKVKMTLDIEGINAQYANGLRRVMLDELVGHCLSAPDGSTCIVKSHATDPYVIDDYINMNIMMIPLRYDIPDIIIENARFEIKINNQTPNERSILSGDIVETTNYLRSFGPIFNPNMMISILNPGYVLEIRDIRIKRGVGSKNARVVSEMFNGAFQVVRRASSAPLDIPQYSDKEQRFPGHKMLYGSGYKQSVFTANPRKHRVTCIIPAVLKNANIKPIPIAACDNMIVRLQTIIDALVKEPNINVILNVSVADTDGVIEGVLVLKYETHTIGALLNKVIYETYPDISSGYIYKTHNYTIELNMSGKKIDPMEIVVTSCEKAISDINEIRKSINGLKVTINDVIGGKKS